MGLSPAEIDMIKELAGLAMMAFAIWCFFR